MKLIELSYQDSDWEIQDLRLDDLNLLVGKNAVGKSRTLMLLETLYQFLQQRRRQIKGAWSLTFKENEDIMHYNFSFDNQNVVSETLFFNERKILDRNSTTAQIKDGEEFTRFSPPPNKLALHSHRDTEKYPHLEKVIHWAENAYFIDFSNLIPLRYFDIHNGFVEDKLSDIGYLWKVMEEETQQNVLVELAELSYSIENIDVFYEKVHPMRIKEEGIEKPILYDKLSQGMFRTLAVLVIIEYLLTKAHTHPFLITIDDFCEGLDYQRATKLGKLVFEKCKNSQIQLIATSNDSFLMDVVDIEHWNVLQRAGKVVSAINAHTHPELFDEFKFTGLSNFDFFASDFIAQKQ